MTIRVAVAQMDPQLAAYDRNMSRIRALFEEAVSDGAQLTVFPECATSGYGFGDLAAAQGVVETVPGPTTKALTALCRAHRLEGGGPYVIVGLLERLKDPEVVYNSAVLVGPEGLVGLYRKAHLPLLGVDRFTTPGDTGFLVWETEIGRVGIAICYDLRFPEALRALALSGADIVALPTNWPDGSQNAPRFVTRTRALENRVFILACNRCGEESDFWFFGHSQITDPRGQVLAETEAEEAIVYADIDPTAARQKRIVLRPGEFELDTVGDRRPDLYSRLCDSSSSTTIPHA
ncbi:MAG: carbon-nitrogen hydrolase family protein [Anaerolineae bacterium]